MYKQYIQFFLYLFPIRAFVTTSPLRINEVSDKGTSDTCNGEDWVELYYDDDQSLPMNLTGYVLHDDKGSNDDDAFIFNNGTISPGEFLLVCFGGEDKSNSPQFGIGGDDQVTLLHPNGTALSTTGQLLNRGKVDISFAFDELANKFEYTSTATPGTKNKITLLPKVETLEEMRARLVTQNELGANFFDMDNDGLPANDGFKDIVDFRMKIDPILWEKMYQDQSYEIYTSFLSATVTEMNDESAVLLNLTSPGRIRPKGQSTLFFGTCMKRSIPYSIDFDHTNASQTLFGVQRGYLRTHVGDYSFVREWAQHRMLARFGLPHLRTRKVRFFMNEIYVGFYDFLESPDQDYVFYRNFPTLDPASYGLYKIKTFTLGCGSYDEGSLVRARNRINEVGTPPYAFERGDHRKNIPTLIDYTKCSEAFLENILQYEFEDVTLAYVRAVANDSSTTCGNFLVEEGLIDRDLGVKSLDNRMALFYDKHLGINSCEDAKCSNSDLGDDVDVTNFLRNFAVMASLLNQDSPVGNGNNYYLAQASGIDNSLKIVQYDHNNILTDTSAFLCDYNSCIEHLIHWSIERPTCGALESNQLVGPLLTNNTLRSQYIDYVREFIQSVMMNQTFLDQVHNHLKVIKSEIVKDSWNDLANEFDLELDRNSDQWLHYFYGAVTYIPFLPAMKARSADIMNQLDAIDKNKLPRNLNEISFWEVCVDWKSEIPPKTACYENCYYDGCHRPQLTIPSWCDTEREKCIHGIVDSSCAGVSNLGSYPGMERNFEGSDEPAFCWYDQDLGPIRIADCPEPTSDASTVNTYVILCTVLMTGLFSLLI